MKPLLPLLLLLFLPACATHRPHPKKDGVAEMMEREQEVDDNHFFYGSWNKQDKDPAYHDFFYGDWH